jgi:hypothetical protein
MGIASKEFVKDYFGIRDSSIDGRIELMIGLVEKDYQNIANKVFDKDEKGNVVYPKGAEETAALMVMYKISNAGKISVCGGSVKAEQEVSSESWGDHAISYQNGKEGLNQSGEMKGGYPAGIVSRIERYVGFKAVKDIRYQR